MPAYEAGEPERGFLAFKERMAPLVVSARAEDGVAGPGVHQDGVAAAVQPWIVKSAAYLVNLVGAGPPGLEPAGAAFLPHKGIIQLVVETFLSQYPGTFRLGVIIGGVFPDLLPSAGHVPFSVHAQRHAFDESVRVGEIVRPVPGVGHDAAEGIVAVQSVEAADGMPEKSAVGRTGAVILLDSVLAAHVVADLMDPAVPTHVIHVDHVRGIAVVDAGGRTGHVG